MHQTSLPLPSMNSRRFVDWDEQFVSHDRGSRVVHYYLKDHNGHAILAVIGTERSLRHMVYVVCDDFLPLAGLDKSTTAAFKWRARREVVEWLTSLIAKSRSSSTFNDMHIPGSPKHDQSPISELDATSHDEDMEGWETVDEDRDHGHEHVPKNHCTGKTGAVLWVGTSWSCRKRLRHYNSFQRNGITISVQDFVYVMSEEKEHHIGYVEDMYEDKKSRKKLRIRWFHKTNELFCKIPPPTPHFREVFYTPFPQVLSVECVDGLATVLKPEHFEKCSQTLPPEAMADIHLCSRQFDGEGIKPFNICEVKGYWHQKAFKTLDLSLPLQSPPNDYLGSDDMEADEEEDIEPGNVIKRGPRTVRYCRRRIGNADSTNVCSLMNLACGSAQNQSCFTAHGNTDIIYSQRLDGTSSLALGVNFSTGQEQADQRFMLFDVGDKIEALSEDSGIRGCWFKGTVTRRVSRRLKIRYDDLVNEDGNGNLEEWVSACKVAALDTLGLRIPGRVTLRPRPSKIAPFTVSEVGLAVDAWWHDGWWEGIITKVLPGGEVQVYFPGESDMSSFQQIDLRESRDWVNGQWVGVKSNPEILSTIDTFSVGELNSVVERQSPLKSSNYPIIVDPPAHVDHRVRQFNSVGGPMDDGVKESLAAEEITAGECANASHASGNEVLQSDITLQRSEAIANFVSSSYNVDESDCTKLLEETSIAKIAKSEHVLHKESGSDDCTCVRCVEVLNLKQLRWKSGRKRQRQGDICTSRMEKSGNQFNKEQARESSAESIQDEDASLSLQEDSSETKWQSVETSDSDLVKTVREGHEGASPMNGPTGGNNIFMNSLPVASLVMSR
ncbi:hypothetical protein O6H91_21G053800 [Diphasiastrum complanatum]|uniref:Uncharacterized protein n=2 Tax=Diphasiastrum complanatum TaxID=34168 RepID=A0ACC2AKZ6_DIPCM|nr:hypothetical protein O6H91_21G053800 [Diphasiastrum complanatum]KAJ7518076.1 hypothetical protein O6H91_21G053800 [Diphasiastrum complanatum]